MIKKGDTAKVRLHTGEVVEAVYLHSGYKDKTHWVSVGDNECYVSSCNPQQENEHEFAVVRFVGNPCVLLPIGGE